MSRLDEIRQRLAKTTPGPWWYDGRDLFSQEQGTHHWDLLIPMEGIPSREDGDFIARAREDVEFLLDLVERLKTS